VKRESVWGKVMIGFRLDVLVVADETEMTLPGLFVKAYDKDLLFDDLLGGAVTDLEGRAQIVSEEGDFNEFFDRRPDVYFKVFNADRSRVLHETRDAVRWNARRDESFTIRVPVDDLVGMDEEPSVDLFTGGDSDGERLSPAIGDSLQVSGAGLAPGVAHDVEVTDGDGVLFVSTLMTDRHGSLPESVLWPQFGLDDARSDAVYTVEEADERWRGKELRVRILRGERVVASGAVGIDGFERPFVLNVGEDGRMLNGVVDGEARVTAEIHNVRHDGEVRVYLVERQADWRAGDRFGPVTLRDGSAAFADAAVGADGRVRVVLAEAGNIAPGAYDFVVRPLRYGFEDDDDFVLRATDVATRLVTGVVVREEFWRSKVVQFGCVNMMQLAGRPVSGPPYFRYSEAFAEGESVWVGADPAALPPVNIGKMVAVYVVASKTAAQWNGDTSLTHLAALGGNAAVLKFKTQAGCVNHNMVLVWAAASQPGTYDVVLDFGNNQSDPAAFAPDGNYDAAVPPAVGDFIDGYMVPGFRVVKDPGVYTDPAFANAGGFDYVNEGSLTVTQDDGVTVTVPLTARVRFPADVPGATLPSQVSAAKPSYPLTIIVHGNGHTYQAYDYLLDHWARNGFIAASIHLNSNETATDRAKVLFAHVDKLKTKFGAKAQNNVGIMGHSRGGEGVATAPRLNQQAALGHNLNAVISLAPTNQHVNEHIVPPWATPYYVIYGSLDRDVTGEGVAPLRNSGFALYDKAEGAKKAMLFVYGATHDRFLAPPGAVDLDYGWLAPTDQANAISATAHHAIAQAYMTAYFRQQLLNDPQYEELFRGEWVPPSVAVADGGKAKVFSQYRDAPANRKTVDEFEEAHTATSWQASTIGGGVSQVGLVANPTENFLYLADNVASPHETSGLVTRWDNSGDALEFAVPAAHQNISTFKTLSFRVTQKYDTSGTINPLNADQDFYVALVDAGGKERALRVSKFGPVPYPHVRGNGWFGPVVKSALCTIRIPLHAFMIECAGAQRVDLTQVTKIAFRYQFVPTGEVEIDDLELTA
jgi:hypothetical protein